MPRVTLNLLALLAAFSVAPATASQGFGRGPDGSHESDCPYVRAELAARSPPASEPTTITLTEPVPPESSLFSYTDGAGFLTP
jgi:hypothetical protein